MTKTLNDLINKCHIVHVTANDHRCNYQTVKQYIASQNSLYGSYHGFTQKYLDRLCTHDTFVELHVYPDHPRSSFIAIGTTLAEAVFVAHGILEQYIHD